MNKKSLLFPAILLLGVFSGACNGRDKGIKNEDADKLFKGTCSLAKVYTDSMTHASDSTSLIEMMKRFDERLTQLNFSVAPETDYHLTEGRNDTISMLIDSLRRVYDAKLYSYAHPLSEVDSLSSDSTGRSQNI